MKKKIIVASILSSALLLGVSGCLVVNNMDSKADSATRGTVSLTPKEVEAGEVPNHFTILCSIKSKSISYEEAKNKDFVLCYDVNSQFEGKEKMEMKIQEFEADGFTPKTVYFEAEIVGREKAWIPYTIYTIEKNQVYDKIFCDTFSVSQSELSKHIFESDIYECGFAEEEKASTFDTVVNLKSSPLSPNDVEDEAYTAITYSINGGKEKTVYGHKEINIIPDTAIYNDFNYEAQIFANKGDVIVYKVTVPTKNKYATYQETIQLVVE